ncbi:DUF2303 family protein [Testudinibacter sp. P80/BLE/0925]|uniref:DUF2303 family protein n=1 Tax=Testudinibacter sp. TW-1 TaxID=3417757 RepID=UPI003D36A82D
MDKTAIQEIKDLALSSVRISPTDYPLAIVPKDMQVFPLERYQAQRNSYRVVYRTSHYRDYISYVERNVQPSAQCFVNPDTMSARTLFDLGDIASPGHALHAAELSLSATAAFEAVSSIDERQLEQSELSDWLEDWADNITAFDDAGEEISFANALAAVRKITLDYAKSEEHEVGDFAAKKSAMESVEAKSKLTIPHSFTFTCETYSGLNIRDITLRLRILTGSDEPILVLRMVKAEALKEAIAEEFADKVRFSLTGTDIIVNIGTVEV